MKWAIAELSVRRAEDRARRTRMVDPETARGGRGGTGLRAGVAGAVAILVSAAWFGVVTGLLELSVVLLWHRLAVATVLGALQINRHFSWMIPVAQLAVFTACGLPLAAVALFRPGLAGRAANFLLTALAFFGLLLIVKGLYSLAAAILALGMAYQVRRLLDRHSRGFGRLERLSLPVLLGIVAILGGIAYDRLELEEGRALAALPPARAGVPNVLLIVLDTVRADRLSLYGYHRDTTPNLARLAKRGVVFAEARSAAPWTLPSHASLFTGRWPHELSVRGDRPLDGRAPTLAEILARHGYATAGFVGNTYYCNSWYGLARGFHHYEDYYEQNIIVSPSEALRCAAVGRWLIRLFGNAYNVRPETVNTPKNAARVNHDFLDWLETNGDRPFFAFLNYIDAHDPYVTPPGFDRHFGLKPASAGDLETIQFWHHKNKNGLSDRDLTLIRDAYDDCLAALDEQLGKLFAALEQTGTLNRTLVVLTADHGEQLGEHHLYGHGKSLYRQEVHVPLVFFGPTIAPRANFIERPVSLRNLAATIVDRLGLASESPLPGWSLARDWEPEGAGTRSGLASADDVVLCEASVVNGVSADPRLAPAMRGPMASLIFEDNLYIRDALGREELYDLSNDPLETSNLAGQVAAQPALDRCREAFAHHAPSVPARR